MLWINTPHIKNHYLQYKIQRKFIAIGDITTTLASITFRDKFVDILEHCGQIETWLKHFSWDFHGTEVITIRRRVTLFKDFLHFIIQHTSPNNLIWPRLKELLIQVRLIWYSSSGCSSPNKWSPTRFSVLFLSQIWIKLL